MPPLLAANKAMTSANDKAWKEQRDTQRKALVDKTASNEEAASARSSSSIDISSKHVDGSAQSSTGLPSPSSSPSPSSAFWTLPSIVRAESLLDVWASVKRARSEGITENPTLDAIFERKAHEDAKVKTIRREESQTRQRRRLSDGSVDMVWLVRFIEEHEERFARQTSSRLLTPQHCCFLAGERWLIDIGRPPLLEAFLGCVYPRTGPYTASWLNFELDMLFGTGIKAGRAGGLSERAFGHLHRQALRDLSDFLSDFGVRTRKVVA